MVNINNFYDANAQQYCCAGARHLGRHTGDCMLLRSGDGKSEVKSCSPIPCPSFGEAKLVSAGCDHVPTVDELRQAGCAILMRDGTFYSLGDGRAVHFSADGELIDD